MLIRSVIQKVLAFFLVFTLTFANIALVTKAYASTMLQSVFFSSSNTGSKNVEFDAYFNDTGQEKTYWTCGKLNADSVLLNLDLSVQDAGYLKNAQIAILETTCDSGLNFKVNSQNYETGYEYVKSFNNNVLKLKQIPSGSGINLKLPLVFENEDFIKLQKLDNSFIVELTGIYVNSKGKEIKIKKTVTLELAWIDIREIKLFSEVQKCIPIESGLLLQTLVKVDSKSEKSGAVKETNLEIELPTIQGGEIEEVNVISKSTMGTDGKQLESVKFDSNNWNVTENILKIHKVNNSVAHDKYYSKSGEDEYEVTYKVNGLSLSNQKITSKIKAEVITYGKENIINKAEQNFEYDISNQKGKLVTYELQNEIENISKGYVYHSYNNVLSDKAKICFNYKSIINISNSQSIDKIRVEDTNNCYKDLQENEYQLKDVYYNKLSISKDIFDRMLGENGEIKIFGTSGVQIGKLSSDSKVDDKNNYVYYFDLYSINQVVIETSKILEDGNLIFNIEKVQRTSDYDKNLYKTFNKMIFSSKVNDEEQSVEIELKSTATKADLVLSTNNILAQGKNDVNMIIKLNNEKIDSDIYGDSVFEIEFPDNIENVKIKDYNIANSQGLNLEKVELMKNENNHFVIRATIKGLQSGLSSGILTKGTNIMINTEIELDTNLSQLENEIILRYTNLEATNYLEGGTQTQKLIFIVPSEGKEVSKVEEQVLNEEILIEETFEENVQNANLKLEVQNKRNETESRLKENGVSSFKVFAKNESEQDLENVNIKVHIDDKFKILNIFLVDPQTENIEELSLINRSNDEINLKFDKIKAMTEKIIAVNVKAESLKDGKLEEISNIYATSNDVKSNSIEYKIGKPVVKITQKTNTPNYLKTGEQIEYEFLIENEGTYTSGEFKFECDISENLVLNEFLVTNTSKDIIKQEKLAVKGNFERKLEVGAKQKIVVTLICTALPIKDDYAEIKNKAKISSEFFETVESNELVHVLENRKTILENKSKIAGTVWLDENADGIRDKEENILANTQVMLLDSNTGQILDSRVTDSGGNYSFETEKVGDYLVLFKYDSNKYMVSAFQKKRRSRKQ